MALKFKEEPKKQEPQNNNFFPLRYEPVITRPMGLPPGIPKGVSFDTVLVNRIRQPIAPPPLAMPGSNLLRAVNYYADYNGCGWWRMITPELVLNMNQKAIISGLTTMIVDPRFYQGIKAVKLQRQATPMQLEFVKFLKQGSSQLGFKTIYEIDDIIFKDDIPDFNRCKDAFNDPKILESAIEMMRMCDEITVTCEYMKQYYIAHTGNKNITVIPNYPMKMWFDGHYDRERLSLNYDKYKKKPRIGYFGSGTHIDIVNRTNQKDDFHHVVDTIIKTRKDFTWVFIGAFPLAVKPFIDNGEMEYIQWANLLDYSKAIAAANVNAVYAPLVDCHFNKAKSEIKFLEAACVGVPGVFQDLVTYKNAPLRFTTGADLIDQLNVLLKDKDTYMKYSTKSRNYAETMWLDDHWQEHYEAYFTNIGSEDRKALLKLNPDQIIT